MRVPTCYIGQTVYTMSLTLKWKQIRHLFEKDGWVIDNKKQHTASIPLMSLGVFLRVNLKKQIGDETMIQIELVSPFAVKNIERFDR